MLGLLLVAGAAGCGRGPGSEHEPRPQAVVPARGFNQRPVAVELRGARFLPLATQHVGGGAPLTVDARFSARLGEVALDDVTWVSDELLRATVPALLPAGTYPLTVSGPMGRSGTVEAAYTSSEFPFAVLSATLAPGPPAVLVGAGFDAELTVRNDGDGLALAVAPGFSLGGTALAQAAPAPAPVDLSPGQAQVFRSAVTALGGGTLVVSGSALARDAESGEALAAGPVAAPAVQVLTPAALAGATAAPAQVSVAQRFAVRLTVTNSGQAAALAVAPALALSGPAAVDVAPAAAEVPGGASQSFEWTVHATGPGAVALTASAAGTDAVGGGAVASAPSAASVQAQAQAALSALGSAPAALSVGQRFDVTLTVANLGEAAALGVTPTLLLPLPAIVQVLAGPGAQDVPGGAAAEFRWSCQATAAGSGPLQASAAGTDGNSGAALSTGPLSLGPVTVQDGPTLAGSVTFVPAQVSVGQAVVAQVLVANVGSVAALAVEVAAPAQTGPGQLLLQASPTGAVGVPAGQSHLFVFGYQATGAGPVTLGAALSGVDANSGAPVTGTATGPPLRVETPAALAATLGPARTLVNRNQPLTLTLTVQNSGQARAVGVTAGPLTSSAPLALLAGPTPAAAEVDGGAAAAFAFQVALPQKGPQTFSAQASGRDGNSDAGVATGPTSSVVVTVQDPAALGAVWTVPARVSVGQDFPVAFGVANTGDATALAVTVTVPGQGGSGGVAVVAGPAPASADVPGQGGQAFAFTLRGAAAGTVTLSSSASGIDATDLAAVSVAPLSSAAVTVQQPAALVASLSAPARAGRGAAVTVSMQVSNPGQADALAVAPSSLSTAGTGAAVLLSGPSPAQAPVAGGASATFTWTYTAAAAGTVTFSGGAGGSDANALTPVAAAPASSGAMVVEEAQQVSSDPFGDGTSFSYLFKYAGLLYLGPSASGGGAVRSDGDGSNPQSVTFGFTKDLVGNKSSNNWAGAPPYLSIGASGCAANTAACGPDNEDGRGLFTAGTVAGTEWLVVGGARTGGALSYVYLTPDTGPAVTFRFADVSVAMGGATKGFSAARVFQDRLYLGFPDTGGNRPYFVVLKAMPSSPGLDAVSPTQVESLDGDKMPGIRVGNPDPTGNLIIDSLWDFGARLYLANNGGVMRSTTTQPQPYNSVPTDWANATPTAAAWTGKAAIGTAKVADLEPADRAVPQLATWRGRLYLARNTTAGPQLWACAPALSGSATDCDGADWSLLAPNSAGDTSLSAFNDANNLKVTLLVATAQHLYVGYDNAVAGLELYRTAALTPTARADFEGQAGCNAALAPASCAGLGGNGLGAGVTRIWDAAALTFGAQTWLYLTAGTPTTPVRVFRLYD